MDSGMTNVQLILFTFAVFAGVGVVGTALASAWSKMIYPDTFDRDRVFTLAKIFFGIGGFFFILFLVLKFT